MSLQEDIVGALIKTEGVAIQGDVKKLADPIIDKSSNPYRRENG